jgi:hypothetical protein
MRKTTLELLPGDEVLWPIHQGIYDTKPTRHHSGRVVRIHHDPERNGCVVGVECEREWFYSGAGAVHDVVVKEGTI